MKYIKEADEGAKEKELKDKKTENIKKEAVKQAWAAERKAKKNEKIVTRSKAVTRLTLVTWCENTWDAGGWTNYFFHRYLCDCLIM